MLSVIKVMLLYHHTARSKEHEDEAGSHQRWLSVRMLTSQMSKLPDSMPASCEFQWPQDALSIAPSPPFTALATRRRYRTSRQHWSSNGHWCPRAPDMSGVCVPNLAGCLLGGVRRNRARKCIDGRKVRPRCWSGSCVCDTAWSAATVTAIS
jgi:hypothetical protein